MQPLIDFNIEGESNLRYAMERIPSLRFYFAAGFKTLLNRVEHCRAGGICLFIQSDKAPNQMRAYRLRSFNTQTGELLRLNEDQEYYSLRHARAALIKWKEQNPAPAGFPWLKDFKQTRRR